MKVKEALICRSAFPKFPINLGPELLIQPGVAYIEVTKVKIGHALTSQLAIKTPWLNKINFQILHII